MKILAVFRPLLRRNFILTLFVVNVPVACYIYYKLNLMNYAWYNRLHRWNIHCRTPAKEMNELIKLSRDLHFALDDLNITHWLAYGSLWGAIRYKDPLPWDNDVDIGVLYDDIKRLPEGRLESKLTSCGMKLHYSSWGGYYRVTRSSVRADLMLFHEFKENGSMERIGLESYFFFVNYKKMHAFPSELLRTPLPRMLFAGVYMPVPQRGLEIQKYHYPYDWWKVSKPAGC